MTPPIKALLEEISRDHYPAAPATSAEIEAFEQKAGWRLDADLRAFYLHCNGAWLFEPPPDSPFRFLPLEEIERGRKAIFGEDEDQWGPASLYVICDIQDGDYVMIDVSKPIDSRYPLLDGWKEAWRNKEYSWPLANSFSEFLERALRSGGHQFWLSSPPDNK